MSELKHTPGPWHTKVGDTPGFRTQSGGIGIYAPARPSDDFFILQIASMETNLKGAEVKANGRLIAAAPQLLEALGWYADQMCEQGSASEVCGRLTDDDCAGCRARAAIAAATGEAQ